MGQKWDPGPACVTLPGVIRNKREKEETCFSAAWEETAPAAAPEAICQVPDTKEEAVEFLATWESYEDHRQEGSQQVQGSVPTGSLSPQPFLFRISAEPSGLLGVCFLFRPAQ